ncbi:hypothetical protein [Streptomyces sp. NPDC014791]|uniref:hypothetical protein n=1 Tax=Streptomyces sp. NPDC014791 TaxID=3364912 RepID=UPI00370169A3
MSGARPTAAERRAAPRPTATERPAAPRPAAHPAAARPAAARLRTAAALTAALLSASAAPAVANGSLITVIDNSRADSVLEVDRTANLQTGSGTAGSDHDGSAVDLMHALLDATGPAGGR